MDQTAAAQPHMDYWQILVRRKWVVLAFFVIASASVTIGTSLQTPLYRADTSVMVEGENINVTRAEDTSASGSFDIFENYLETQVTVIKSKGIAGRVADNYKLGDTPRYREKNGLARFFQHKFTDDIELVRTKGTRMITISVYNPDAQMAADLANSLAEAYTQDNMQRRALSFIRNQRMASLNTEFLRLQSRYDELSHQFGPKHPDMIDLRNEINIMSERINSQRYAEGDPLKPEAADGGRGAVQELLKIQEGSVLSSSRISNVNIVDRAAPPKKIAKPKRLVNIALGLFGGLFGGIFLAFLVDYLDSSIKTEEDVRKYAGNAAFLGHLFKERAKTTQVIDQTAALQPESPSTDAYRLVRTRLLWSLPKNTDLKDLAVLSSGPGEGKTTFASNLAIVLSQLNNKVLLVDADIRRGRLHDSFDLKNEKGLGEYLTDGVPFESVVQQTGIKGLSAITSGRSVIESSQLLSSEKMKDFIRESRGRYDYIVYDTPPITILSDASILISQLGGAVLIVRGSFTGFKMFQRAISMVRESGTRFLGVVLNAAESGSHPHYYKYYQPR